MSNEQDPIIIKNISKRYYISHKDRAEHHSIKDAFVDVVKKPLQLLDSHYGKHKEEIKALDNVSFNVKKGQVMAVMGKNGSGKSTLFKILAKVTSPTSGEAIINGRVGSLLEVGAGFHPELTGRENMHFNGSILGMKKAEIYEKYDSILEFAGMGKFIDTPVKFYSSGMKVRLAFSIAIHLDTDILLLDEVMAVGDYDFRMKCFAKMEEIASQGKTILFVSHMPSQIRRICTHGVVLRDGKVIFQGEVEDVISEYLGELEEDKSLGDDESDLNEKLSEESTHGPIDAEITEATSSIEKKMKSINLVTSLRLQSLSNKALKDLRARLVLRDEQRNEIAIISNTLKKNTPVDLSPNQSCSINFNFENIPLAPGEYSYIITLQQDKGEKKKFHQIKNAAKFIVPAYSPYDSQESTKQKIGPIVFNFSYKVEKE